MFETPETPDLYHWNFGVHRAKSISSTTELSKVTYIAKLGVAWVQIEAEFIRTCQNFVGSQDYPFFQVYASPHDLKTLKYNRTIYFITVFPVHEANVWSDINTKV